MSAGGITPIETRYAGHRFRSRLEARWAVFLDHLGVRWEYEPQGYELPSGARYLPDFWLPQLGLHVEVKGAEAAFRTDAPRYAEAVQTGALPGQGLLILGPVPDATGGAPRHFVLTTERHCCGDRVLCLHGIFDEWFCYDASSGTELPLACTDLISHAPGRLPALKGYAGGYTDCGPMPEDWPASPKVAAAYKAARSARFEYGESGVS